MAPSRSTRIVILLVIDVIFFFVELISGYAVGSLALVADSFHMLNDVLSLIVALYAIKLSRNTATDEYSYGWHRAEILGALVNGVFLLTLCCSIFMEALERIFSPPEIRSPEVIMIVGSLGLASNFVGLLLFHEHSHSHDSPSVRSSSPEMVDAAPLSPEELERQPLIAHSTPRPVKSSSTRRPRSPSISSSIYQHPAQTRAQIVQMANEMSTSHGPRSPSTRRSRLSLDKDQISAPQADVSIDADSDALVESPSAARHSQSFSLSHSHSHAHSHSHSHSHSPQMSQFPAPSAPVRTASPAQSSTHSHTGGHGHSHGSGSMNMRALVLHVLGDALGNVGVIATGLVILLVKGDWRVYFDPAISLVIAVIIFTSAFPLVKSTSLILLQGVPSHVSLTEVRNAMMQVAGVRSVHELHVWQLSETKVIASVHVQIARASDYMHIANEIRRVLHEHGVHSATIQPEYGNDDSDSDSTTCLVMCPPNNVCDDTNVCCPAAI